MKIFNLTFLLLIGNFTFGQLKVLNSGRVAIGSNAISNNYKMEVTSSNVCGLSLNVSHIDAYAWNSICHTNHKFSKNWIVSWNGDHRFFVLGCGDLESKGKLSTSQNMYAKAFCKTSDTSLKFDFQTIQNPISLLNSINSYSFKYKTNDSFELDSLNISLGGRFYGFKAQELALVLPNAVFKNEKGLYSVDYTSIIPILVDVNKFQKTQIDLLQSQIITLNNQINTINNQLALLNIGGQANPGSDEYERDQVPVYDQSKPPTKATLYQNKPNPITNSSVIDIYLPSNFQNKGKLYINDLNGKIIEEFVLNGKGLHQIVIQKDKYQKAIYEYTLFVNDYFVDSKKMIVE